MRILMFIMVMVPLIGPIAAQLIKLPRTYVWLGRESLFNLYCVYQALGGCVVGSGASIIICKHWGIL